MPKNGVVTQIEEIKPTSAAQWRKSREALMVLPVSGNTMKLKPVGIMELLELGRIPQTLAVVAARTITGQQKLTTEKDLEDYTRLVNVVVCACAVEPRVVMRPKADEQTAYHEEPADALYIDEITFKDREEVFKWACAMGGKLRPFRPEQEGAVPAARSV